MSPQRSKSKTTRSSPARTDDLRARFPHAAAFFDGYLHEDFLHIHGSPRAAAEAFRGDASVKERRLVAEELAALVATLQQAPKPRARGRTAPVLGSWAPRSIEDISELLDVLRSKR